MYIFIGILLYFESFITGIPFLDYSDKLAIGAVIIFLGYHFLIKKDFKKWFFKIIESRQILFFLSLLLVSVLSLLITDIGISKDNLFSLKILFFCFIFFLFFAYIGFEYKKIRKVVFMFVVLEVITCIFSLVTLYFPAEFLNIFEKIVPESTFGFYEEEIIRGRVAPIGALMGVYLLPLFFIEGKNKVKSMFYWMVFVLGCLAILLHSYRGDVVAMFLGLTFFGIVFFLKSKSKHFYLKYLIFSFFVIFLIGLNLPIARRFMLKDDYDIQTINSRRRYASVALDLFEAEKIFGVGYGNYQKIADPMVVNTFGGGKQKTVSLPGSPHNQFLSWLSETGLVGSLGFVTLLMVFVLDDFKYIRRNKYPKPLILVLMISSWVLVVVSLLNSMAINLFYVFYAIRGMLLGNSLIDNNVTICSNDKNENSNRS
ncbi:O-antigen ligase family protein [Patescibacteria group bacterium]|nr:O-antigen ligase family protein [Patescibacteria group bacterium]